ncbi:hypothetical protein N7495_000581 [Penicillium taxi]|uniref:uncharacterized protein n=1 Tax=Penicillium taxi TaxID=168475 RepID=UPI0025455E8B|nr:uncharacterized protein N7495_000581 [Penicillium taxi]KAJ5907899.1 hypothetical protein N7495_000581 [Penicillium taxi]
MAGYNGRRAPNFSQYLDDLNAIPSPYDQALQQQQQQQNTFTVDNELAMFTNAEFFDFDGFGDLSLPNFDSVDQKQTTTNEVSGETDQNGDMKFLDFLNDGMNNISEYSPELGSLMTPSMQIQNAPFSGTPTVPNVASTPAHSTHMSTPQNVVPASPLTIGSAGSSPAAPKRKSSKSTQASAEEAARNAAEEDKRRRNTAASARFRVKKKQREQALERSLKETADKSDALAARVSQLELENHWLRGLIMEKNGTEERDEASEKAISEMFKNFMASRESDPSNLKLGVGTIA